MLLFLASFDCYDHTVFNTGKTGGDFDNWLHDDSSGDFFISQSYGRNNKSGLRLTTNSITTGQRAGFAVHLGANYTELVCGAAVRINSDIIGSAIESINRVGPKILFSFVDGSTTQVSIGISPSMRLCILDSSQNYLYRSTFTFKEGVYYYIEADATISHVTGNVKIYVDGVQIENQNVDTQSTSTSNAYCNGVRFGWPYFFASGAVQGGRYFLYDHIYILEKSSGQIKDRLGDTHIEGLLPNREYQPQWTPSSGTLNYAMVSENPPDDASTYLYTNTSGITDYWRVEPPSISAGSVLALASNIYARKNKAGVSRITPTLSLAGTQAAGSDLYLSTDWRYYQTIVEQQPTLATVGTVLLGVTRV